MKCPHCEINMFAASKPLDIDSIENIWFCPRCRSEIHQEIVKGYMEVEDDYYAKISFNNSAFSAKDLMNFRSLDIKLASIPILELKEVLASKPAFLLGAYTKDEADYIYTKAIEFNFIAEIPQLN